MHACAFISYFILLSINVLNVFQVISISLFVINNTKSINITTSILF